MCVTVDVYGNQNIRMTDEIIDTRPPDRVAFAAEGVITMTKELLSEFEGASLKPVRIDIIVEESRTIETDLEEEASLRLETVDVGVVTPDKDDLSPGMDTIQSSAENGEPTDTSPGAIAFTVEGTITGVPEEALEPISEGTPKLKSIVFAVENPTRGDGGSGNEALYELGLLGYTILIYRNGAIEVDTRGRRTNGRLH